ncbi:MAG TPA: nucleoside phosphorylase [Saprospiraceae bacterium]|nr:nucleoside phosphorylase [Saprospiraceae bacterium]
MRESELILNADGSIYHLALLPEDVASTIILVGDQNRVELVSRHFDRIEIKKHRREFITHTGWIGEKRLTVMSTGIGTDNIDIALNELDALVNIDFKTRSVKNDIKSLRLVRIGTSGSIHPDIHLDDVVVSLYAIGTDFLGQYYGNHQSPHEDLPYWSYLVKAYPFDLSSYSGTYKEGVTITCPGFYAAQGRSLRITPEYILPIHHLHEISIHGLPITNIEMETSGLYLLSEKMGHQAISFNLILAQRLAGSFHKSHADSMNRLIEIILKWV